MAKPIDLKQIRQQIRESRGAIPKNYAVQASYKFSERFQELDSYQAAKCIAGYVPFEGEADPLPLMDRAIQEGKQVFVPVIVAKASPLKFAPWTRSVSTKKNRMGIEEPDIPANSLVSANELEFVITPLVAFDERCNRIGVGGGYYDRSFEFLRDVKSEDRKTVLVGMAYEMQFIDEIENQEWDVRLDGVVTELKTRTV
jgi:5-formyltetrahydrofolate cyclo-ligase